MDISVVSGTYNRLKLLQRMVASVRTSIGKYTYEIVLVDGGSTDGTIEWCRQQQDVLLVEQGELLGAVKAFNEGAAQAHGDYVAFLNDDIEVAGDTLSRACTYLRDNPHVGQVAFKNVIRGTADKNRQALSKAYGYLYGQCCMTPKVLGDLAEWWGSEGMRTYGGDTRFSLRLWEMGYPTVSVDGCEIVDYVYEDDLRRANNEEMRGPSNTHPDSVMFHKVWKDRLPPPNEWRSAPINNVLAKAATGTLRTMRFKAMMRHGDPPRVALINALGAFGPAKQVLQIADNDQYQKVVLREISQFKPDLVIFQAQREGKGVAVATIAEVRKVAPRAFLINWDGDTHYPVTSWHGAIAKAVDLQLVVSPSLFDVYKKHGAYVGYWPIGIEDEYMLPRERAEFDYDISFLGALYGIGKFPEAEVRRDSVKVLLGQNDLRLGLYGYGWAALTKEKVDSTCEQHSASADIYARSKMALSVSQAADLWGYTSDRLYQITATGCPALVQRFAGMEEHGYVDTETCIAWATLDEMLEKARYYIEHDEEREAIGTAGREMTLERHTWKHRLDGLFAMVGGLGHG